MTDKELEALRKIYSYESSAPPEEWQELGWSWQQAGVRSATINRLIERGFVRITYHSNRFTNYKLTEEGRETVIALETPTPGTDTDWTTFDLPPDLFDDIVGYDDLKELLKEVMMLEDQFHVLLAGPPAIAKTMFLSEVERAMGTRSLWVVGSSASKAGVWDKVSENLPDVIIINELEKMAQSDLAGLLSLMEGGRLTRIKVHREMDVTVPAKVIADVNKTQWLPPELLSRFHIKKLEPYEPDDFLKVVKRVLAREGLDEDAAARAAMQLLGKTNDIRHAVRVGRLSKRVGVDKAVRLLS